MNEMTFVQFGTYKQPKIIVPLHLFIKLFIMSLFIHSECLSVYSIYNIYLSLYSYNSILYTHISSSLVHASNVYSHWILRLHWKRKLAYIPGIIITHRFSRQKQNQQQQNKKQNYLKKKIYITKKLMVYMETQGHQEGCFGKQNVNELFWLL